MTNKLIGRRKARNGCKKQQQQKTVRLSSEKLKWNQTQVESTSVWQAVQEKQVNEWARARRDWKPLAVGWVEPIDRWTALGGKRRVDRHHRGLLRVTNMRTLRMATSRSLREVMARMVSWARFSSGSTARSHQHQAGPLGLACRRGGQEHGE